MTNELDEQFEWLAHAELNMSNLVVAALVVMYRPSLSALDVDPWA